MKVPAARAPRLRSLIAPACLAVCATSVLGSPGDKSNYFDDPFVQVTAGITNCPVPDGPAITLAEMKAQAHSRAERGTSCYLSGRCRLPNAYLYDKEIIPRVKRAIDASGRFADSSVWIEGKRRWVWLKGCVRRPSDAAALKQLVRSIDDVEAVIDELAVRPR
jgi:BON domain